MVKTLLAMYVSKGLTITFKPLLHTVPIPCVDKILEDAGLRYRRPEGQL